jgi:hypothetical protein
MSSKRVSKWLILVFVTLSAFVCWPSSARQPKMVKCWYIEEHNKLLGDNQIYASQQAVKIVFFNKKWIDIAKAPDWELYVLSPTAKIYWHTPLDKWKGTILIQSASAIDRKVKPIKTAETKKICSFTALKYTATGTEPDMRGKGDFEEYWVTKDLALPKQINQIVSGNAGIPEVGGFPLRAFVKRNSIKPTLALDTASAKITTVPEDFFKIPAGYKYTDKPEAVMSGGVMNILEQVLSE